MLLGVDVGGTFTDAVLVRHDGSLRTAKVASTPQDQSIGVLEAVAAVLGEADATDPGAINADVADSSAAGAADSSAADVARFAHGMTVATNALIEGRTARTALLATEGFTDVVQLARQARPELYRLCAAPPAPLVPPDLRFAVPERMTPDGPLRSLRRDDAEAVVASVAEARPDAVAVVLLHSYAHPEHELLLGELLRTALPDVHVSLSHQLVGTFREYERAATTELDAALSPLLAGYLDALAHGARAASLPSPRIMQSSGGLTDVGTAASHAALTVLSGPAGGVGGALLLADLAGETDLLSLDMGGTSCDVCLVLNGEVAETAQRTVAGRPLALPSLDIHTVGAGGGSIAWCDAGGALRVGPRSAGAQPGPACYGRGGHEPTVTDANVLLGRLPTDAALAGGLRLDRQAAERAVAGLAARLSLDTRACAEGIVRVAESEMLRALRVISVQRGIDPRRLTLLAFGGAGPLHAAALARSLGIPRVLCPSASGVLCALGLAAAAPRRDVARTVLMSGPEITAERLDAERGKLVERACEELGEPLATGPRGLRMRAEMRYRGQSFELSVEARPNDGPSELVEAFAQAHKQHYGYRDDTAEVQLVTLRVSAFGSAPTTALTATPTVRTAATAARTATPTARTAAPAVRTARVVVEGRELEAMLLKGPFPQGTRIAGPAVCVLGEATLFVPPGWSGAVDAHGTIVLDVEAPA